MLFVHAQIYLSVSANWRIQFSRLCLRPVETLAPLALPGDRVALGEAYNDQNTIFK